MFSEDNLLEVGLNADYDTTLKLLDVCTYIVIKHILISLVDLKILY